MINRLTFRAAALCLVALLAACSTTPPPAPPVKTVSAPHFETASFAEMPAIEAADWLAGFNAFRTSCTALRSKPAWQSVCAKADETPSELAQAFFESNFTPWRVSVGQFEGETLVAKKETGLATGYYEPLLQGSRERVPPYIYPIYGVPDDLLIIDLADLYPSLKGLRLRGTTRAEKYRSAPTCRAGPLPGLTTRSPPSSCRFRAQGELPCLTAASCESALPTKTDTNTVQSATGSCSTKASSPTNCPCRTFEPGRKRIQPKFAKRSHRIRALFSLKSAAAIPSSVPSAHRACPSRRLRA